MKERNSKFSSTFVFYIASTQQRHLTNQELTGSCQCKKWKSSLLTSVAREWRCECCGRQGCSRVITPGTVGYDSRHYLRYCLRGLPLRGRNRRPFSSWDCCSFNTTTTNSGLARARASVSKLSWSWITNGSFCPDGTLDISHKLSALTA